MRRPIIYAASNAACGKRRIIRSSGPNQSEVGPNKGKKRPNVSPVELNEAGQWRIHKADWSQKIWFYQKRVAKRKKAKPTKQKVKDTLFSQEPNPRTSEGPIIDAASNAAAAREESHGVRAEYF
ncbi:hypothetical protein I6J18_15140 [Peribacillus psychrosaccharolyticus]|uniref:Uncharacterized protein n=1 Tax=Peribacillus psychrosaccharolyticus TaxID=1407 RepID=A0A974NJF6_PERPY|nr:hypothetical protein [Peribacillus psychrosaccharolyticus]MEC2055282.1 hypothetical protein [Peribacillus psychrosaccharolyticus]MED3745272.1 hypothetical protein [Peribacillus psychrosaccharolyticus]QQS98981.1 hypothetical protein I6J18_15140 [Peribacillus psychrosaccharolyticus]